MECPSDRLVRILGRQDTRTTVEGSDEEDSDQSLRGLHFRFNNRTYKVTRVPSDPLPIEAICLSDGNVRLFSNRERVEAEVDKYLS